MSAVWLVPAVVTFVVVFVVQSLRLKAVRAADREFDQAWRRCFNFPPEPVAEEDRDYTIEADDWWRCSACAGLGQVLERVDWETGAPETSDCVRCYGTGTHEGLIWLAAER